ncbi:MAG: GAF domain-containing protein, partial [Chloroflexi bacterium]|nr:GAF domain-containing protein [Chloroflexota bacterium]
PPPPLERHRVVGEALRHLARLVRADATGVYLFDAEGRLRLCASFGLPQWLVAQLEARAAPATLVRTVASRRRAVFETGHERFPQPTAEGQGMAVPLACDQEVLGGLFVVGGRGRAFLPGEIQVVETVAVYLGILVVQQRKIEDFQRRLYQVHRLTSFGAASVPELGELCDGR